MMYSNNSTNNGLPGKRFEPDPNNTNDDRNENDNENENLEKSKILKLMMQHEQNIRNRIVLSANETTSQRYFKNRTQNQMKLEVSNDYICHICGKTGHHIKLCPYQRADMKKVNKKILPGIGIKKSLLQPISAKDIHNYNTVYSLPNKGLAVLKEQADTNKASKLCFLCNSNINVSNCVQCCNYYTCAECYNIISNSECPICCKEYSSNNEKLTLIDNNCTIKQKEYKINKTSTGQQYNPIKVNSTIKNGNDIYINTNSTVNNTIYNNSINLQNTFLNDKPIKDTININTMNILNNNQIYNNESNLVDYQTIPKDENMQKDNKTDTENNLVLLEYISPYANVKLEL